MIKNKKGVILLLTKTVIANWNPRTRKWYESKGYKFTKYKDKFKVKVEDLSRGNGILIEVKCDCPDCKNPYLNPMQWKNYLKHVKVDGKYYCRKCNFKLYSRNMKNIKSKKGNSFEQWCVENKYQDVLDRWDYKLNKYKPSEVSYGTRNKYYFKCPKGIHESELKSIDNFTHGHEGVMDCRQCNSFLQWCLNNLSQEKTEDILNRWDYDLNKCKPSDVSYGSLGFNKKGYYFKCPRGTHKSELKSIASFTHGHELSIICSKCNSFAQYLTDTYGENALDLYWDYKKNKDINPWDIVKSSININVWIYCQEKEYHGSYDISCYNFYNNYRCPYCTNRNGKVHPLDSLGTLYPEVLKIWSNKNKKSPYEYMPFSRKRVWWKCKNGKHEDYYRIINSSNNANFNCPECVRERNESFLQEKVRLYLESLEYTILHERKCTIIPKNSKSKTNNTLPFDNEIKELKLIIEVHGEQHYKESSGQHFDKNYNLHKKQIYDRYKKFIAYMKGYNYIAIPYWTDNKKEEWKQLINDKIEEIKFKI